jgi:hypothetical protein
MDNELTVDDVASMGEDDSATLLSDYLKHGAYAPIGEVQEYAEGGEVTGDSLFGTFPERQAAVNAYTNPIVNQSAVGPAATTQQPVSVPTTLTTPALPSALSTMQQPQTTPDTAGFSPIKTGAATTLSAADMLTNIPTYASTARTLPATPTAATPTFAKPVLKAEKDLPKPVINLAAPNVLEEYGGVPINMPTIKSGGISTSGGDTPAAEGGTTAPAVLKTPGGYTYTGYTNFDPSNIAGTKQDITALFQGATNQQQKDVDAVKAEYGNAVAKGDWTAANKLREILTSQEADVARAKQDLATASKYFTGAGGLYELPSAYQSRLEAEYLKKQGVTGYTDLDLGAIGFTPETKADPFTSALTTQQKEFNAANALYGQLVRTYGAESDVAKNYFNDVVTPQKSQFDQISKLAGDVTKTKLYATITGPAATYNAVSNPKISAKTYNSGLTTYGNNIKSLNTALEAANKYGLTGYANKLGELIQQQEDRLAAFKSSAGRASGSPQEGEISDPVARMVAEQSRSKDQGMDSTSRAMLKKFAGGGEAVASASPMSQEFPLNPALYATGEARSLESTELPLIGKVARFIQTEEKKPSARRNPREDITKTDMGAESKEAMDWIADKLFGRTAMGKTGENIAQGLPTTQGKGVVRYLNPDTKEALMGAAGLVTPAGAKAAKEGVEIVAQGAKKAGKKIVDELGPTAAQMLEKTVPRFNIVPEGPSMPRNMQERLEQGKMFTGRLDSFVSEMANPVTKEQFLGSLKGKFREYEISRAAQALADLDKAAKVTPAELASRISKVASPNRYKTTVVEPKESGLHNQYDNVYGEAGSPVGTINLSFEPTAEQLARETNAKEALSTAASLSRASMMTLNSIRDAVAGEPIKEVKSLTDFVSNMSSLPDATKTKTIEELNKLSNDLVSVIQPTLIMDKELESAQRLGSAEMTQLYLSRVKEVEKANVEYNTRSTPFDRKVEIIGQIQKDVMEELRRQEFQKLIDKYKMPVDLSKVPNEEVTTVINDVSRKLKTRAVDDLKSIMVDAKPTIDSVLEEAQKTSTYKGSHTAVNSQPNAMGFSRFTDHTVNIPGIGKRDGMHISEFQSDMFRDIKKEGKAGGSREADIKEVRSIVDGIKTKFDPIKDKLEKEYGGVDSFLFVISNIKNDAKTVSEVLQGPGIGMNASKADQFSQELVKDIKRVDKLKDRVGMLTNTPKGKYLIEEPIASIETQPQVVQQLLIKNAVIGAMQRGKSFISFPGAESKQAKLYEKLPNNLKQVLKDLGEGFEVMPLVLKDKKGVERSHLTLIWDDNTAQRLLNNGVKFKKGGMVEKSSIDNRRYL